MKKHYPKISQVYTPWTQVPSKEVLGLSIGLSVPSREACGSIGTYKCPILCGENLRSMYVCMYACMHACMYVGLFVCM